MTSKAKATEAKPAKKAMPKSAAKAKPVVTKTAPIAEKQEKLVSKIVTVSHSPIRNGIDTMTKTAEKTAETVTAKAKDVFTDLQSRAGEAADKGKKLAADAYAFNKENVAAFVESSKIAAKGTKDLGTTNVDYAKANLAEAQSAFKEITAVRTPTDFVKVQSELAKKGIDTAIEQGAKNTEAMVKLMNDIFQPISNRVAVTTDLFKKAA